MRRIETREDIERRSKRNKVIFSYLILGILLISSIGYAFMSSERSSTQENGGQVDGEYNGRYYATVGGERLSFENSPESVKNVSVQTHLNLSSYSGKPLYIVSDSNTINYEIASTLGKYTERVQTACYGSCDKDLPEKTCDENLIILNATEEPGIYQENNCIFINGDMRSVDAFLYKILGVD